jgi:hypothetical protein
VAILSIQSLSVNALSGGIEKYIGIGAPNKPLIAITPISVLIWF